MNTTEIITFIGELSVLTGIVLPLILNVKKISNGTRCQLRSEMLRIYYNNREKAVIRQYEYENFVILYEGYKALKGNSFIDKIYREVQKWEIIT
ncbi:MAG: hypothetical protein E7652_09135 [Ruminococcaceae bacterium]|nr:hypothetical protein [Oscillospiraceae bacterium]